MASKKKVVLKPALTARVVCDQGHALTGLFVIFKLRPPAEGADDELARVVEASPHPGNPPAVPEPTGDKQKDKEADKAYKEQKKEYDAALKKYEAAEDKTIPPDPSDLFVLGIVDGKGFLQPVHANYNPWYDVATGRDPDTYKLAVGEKYDVCALRHPSPAIARALTRHLNKQATADDKKHRFDTWGTLTRIVTIEGEPFGDGVQPVLKLSEKPEDFVPQGHARYGKWVLYRDMPHQGCVPLAEPARKVQEDLSKLRYPIGSHGKPYDPLPYNSGDNSGGFSGQVQAAVARLQEHIQAGEAFVLAAKDEAHAGNHWVYVLGKSFNPIEHEDKIWKRLPEGFALGVVDEVTADRIAHWVQHGLRKPSEILLQSTLDWSIWMLERGVIALDGWSIFAEAFGVRYGVKPGSSLRSVLVGAWPGAILNSVHKTGLAVDLSGGAQRIPSTRWPIRYEAHWRKNERDAKLQLARAEKQLEAARKLVEQKRALEQAALAEPNEVKRKAIEKTLAGKTYATADAELDRAQTRHARVLADDDDSKFFWKQRWRLYGHSDLDVFGARDAAIARLKQQLAKLSGLPVPDPAVPASTPAQPRGELWKTFSKRFSGVGGADTEAWLDRTLAPFVAFAEQLLALSASDLVDHYFRDSVIQWTPNYYEGDGGSAGKRYGPNDGDNEFGPVPWAKSWANLSAIAYPCQLERIGPHTSSIRDQAWVLGPTDPDAAPVWRAMADYFIAGDDESKDIVYMLSDLTATTVAAPQHKQANTDVPVRRDGELVVTYKPKEIDGELVKQWRLEVRKLDKSLYPGGKGHSKVARGAEVAVLLAAGDKGKPIVQSVIDLLSGVFGAKHFVVVRAGELAKLEVGKPGTGKQLAAALGDAQERFIAAATALAKQQAEKQALEQAAQTAGGQKPKKKTRAELQAEKKAAVEAARKLEDDWTVVLQPVFVHKPDPALIPFVAADQVLLPPGSEAAHLEWWHYQHRSATPSWGELLEECGYSQVVMGTAQAGSKDADGLPVHRGLGYSAKDLSSHPGGFNEGPVENRDAFTPRGG
jgi:hypothetical protein